MEAEKRKKEKKKPWLRARGRQELEHYSKLLHRKLKHEDVGSFITVTTASSSFSDDFSSN